VVNATQDQFAAWGLKDLLLANPELAIRPSTNGELRIAGEFHFRARGKGVEIEDSYQIEVTVPGDFPRDLPRVNETGGRIPSDFHRYGDGSLCLGSPIRLALMLKEGATLSEFTGRCLLPYLFAYSYKEKYGKLPFGELEHGQAGIVDDLRRMFRVDSEVQVLQLLQLAGTQRRKANRPNCPCGSGQRVGKCHHRMLNRLRARLGRLYCRALHILLVDRGVREKQLRLLSPNGRAATPNLLLARMRTQP